MGIEREIAGLSQRAHAHCFAFRNSDVYNVQLMTPDEVSWSVHLPLHPLTSSFPPLSLALSLPSAQTRPVQADELVPLINTLAGARRRDRMMASHVCDATGEIARETCTNGAGPRGGVRSKNNVRRVDSDSQG